MMFGLKNKKKHVLVATFTRVGEASRIGSRYIGDLTKKEVLEKVGEWWDHHGTGLDDYDCIQVFKFREYERSPE